jgi:hypothetical protein
MTNMNMFIALAVVCASIAASAPITVNQVTATVAGVSTSVGAIVLNDTMRYKLTAPFEMTMGTGAAKMGFSGSVEAKTNDNPTCAGLKTITMDASFKLILPSDLTTPITTLKNFGLTVFGVGTKPFEDFIPDVSSITDDGFTISQEIDVSAMTADIDIKLSDKVGPDKQKILELLGTEITFRIALSELRLYKKGVEIPLYIIVEIVKKANMKLPSALCGDDRGANLCGDACGTGDVKCEACDALCTAAGTVIDAVVEGTGNSALFENTFNVAKLLDDVATLASVTDLKGAVRTCAAASSKKCFGIGTADVCPDTLSGATQHHLNALALAVVAFLAYLQM